ncbi:E3 ubiquitin-protein ligase FANCL isoform X1 [Octopus bimaculoides]|nr:E3 ubiquitin-protein ligase FANCL isoform X1 [Octopus bimaculoides]
MHSFNFAGNSITDICVERTCGCCVMDLWEVCPQMVCMNKGGTFYDGYIGVMNQNFRMSLTLPPDGSLQEAEIKFQPDLYYLLIEHQPLIKQRLSQCPNVTAFLQELKVLLEKVVEKPNRSSEQFFRVPNRLLNELKQLGWDKLVYIGPAFKKLHLSKQDEEGRTHILKIQLHAEHPRVQPTCVTDLPKMFKYTWNPNSKLFDLYAQFERVIQSYQMFWNAMEEIDQKTWVLEPEKPTYSATFRRIALSPNSSLQVIFDPDEPQNFVQCHFIGAESVVDPLKKNLNANLQKWDMGINVLQNLENLLEIDFPSPAFTKKEEFLGECGICYSYRLGMELPCKVCESAQCGQPYHQSCLYEWLKTLPSSRYSYNMVFGECPICLKPLSVTITTSAD